MQFNIFGIKLCLVTSFLPQILYLFFIPVMKHFPIFMSTIDLNRKTVNASASCTHGIIHQSKYPVLSPYGLFFIIL